MPESKPTIEQVLAASASHPDLRASLLADPRAALRHFGIEIREGVEIRVVENTPEVLHLTLPPASSSADSDDLSDEQLEAASGGGYGEEQFDVSVTASDSEVYYLKRYEVG